MTKDKRLVQLRLSSLILWVIHSFSLSLPKALWSRWALPRVLPGPSRFGKSWWCQAGHDRTGKGEERRSKKWGACQVFPEKGVWDTIILYHHSAITEKGRKRDTAECRVHGLYCASLFAGTTDLPWRNKKFSRPSEPELSQNWKPDPAKTYLSLKLSQTLWQQARLQAGNPEQTARVLFFFFFHQKRVVIF